MAKKQTPEELFYDHLTLGLIKALPNIPRVCNVTCEKRMPCEKAQIANWEQRHSVYLPEDMKKFYQSTDGFLLQWMYQYAPTDLRRVGCIHIPQLQQISVLRENIETSSCNISNTPLPPGGRTTEQPTQNTASASNGPTMLSKDRWGHPTPVITTKTKIFEINNVNDVAKICMLYESSCSNNPKFYLLELNMLKWIFLADTFSEYFRMALAHLGLPFWELCFSNVGLPSWAEQLFMLLAPHLLENHEPRRDRNVNPAPEHPYNIIDTCVFRLKPKISTKAHTAKLS